MWSMRFTSKYVSLRIFVPTTWDLSGANWGKQKRRLKNCESPFNCEKFPLQIQTSQEKIKLRSARKMSSGNKFATYTIKKSRGPIRGHNDLENRQESDSCLALSNCHCQWSHFSVACSRCNPIWSRYHLPTKCPSNITVATSSIFVIFRTCPKVPTIDAHLSLDSPGLSP